MCNHDKMSDKLKGYIDAYNILIGMAEHSVQAKKDMRHSMDEINQMKIELKSRMKPFHLESAKNGTPVYSASGRPVRILCYNLRGVYPIRATDEIQTYLYTVKGVCCDRKGVNDLRLLE